MLARARREDGKRDHEISPSSYSTVHEKHLRRSSCGPTVLICGGSGDDEANGPRLFEGGQSVVRRQLFEVQEGVPILRILDRNDHVVWRGVGVLQKRIFRGARQTLETSCSKKNWGSSWFFRPTYSEPRLLSPETVRYLGDAPALIHKTQFFLPTYELLVVELLRESQTPHFWVRRRVARRHDEDGRCCREFANKEVIAGDGHDGTATSDRGGGRSRWNRDEC